MNRNVRIFVLLALLVVGIASSVQATPSGGFYVTYYSDATYSEIVGERWYECGSGIGSWGIRTDYEYGYDFDCHTLDQGRCWVCSPDHCVTVQCGVV